MKEKIKIYIISILAIGILIGGFFIWQNYQTIERKYQACLEKCDLENPVLESTEMGLIREFQMRIDNEICIANCKEKYGK